MQARTLLKQTTLLLTFVKNSKLSMLSLQTHTHWCHLWATYLTAHTWLSSSSKTTFTHTFSICRLLSSPTPQLLQLLPCQVALGVLSVLLPLQHSPTGSHWGLQLRFAHHSSYIYVRLSAQRGVSASVNVLVCRCSGTLVNKLSGWYVCNHVTLCLCLIYFIYLFIYT